MQHFNTDSSSNLTGVGLLKVKVELPNGDTATFLVENNSTMLDVIRKAETKRGIRIENLALTVKMDAKSVSVSPDFLVSAYPTMTLLNIQGKIGSLL
jgi:hypothetical protein